MMQEIVYLNGKLIDKDKAHISITDHGFLYGYGLFESMRAYNGKIFLLNRHIKRLHDAAKVIGLDGKLKDINLEKACNDTVTANKLTSARVRLTVTNGENSAMPWVDNSGQPTVVVTAQPYTPLPDEKYRQGFKVGIASVRRMKQSVFSTMKSINYLLNVVARIEMAEKGFDEMILLNDVGEIAEGGGSNVFFVQGGRLITPSADSGIIPGITREVVLNMAKGIGIKTDEKAVSVNALKKSDEVFLTNAIIEIMPVVTVDDEKGKTYTIGNGKPGEITHRLMTAYREMVGKETLNPNT
jgi:branched-chain amino acid aminotransferase